MSPRYFFLLSHKIPSFLKVQYFKTVFEKSRRYRTFAA
ncbi:Uncharacterized protein dnm_038230 [Desulfonema magnum]|uniref:Uncharacterized protein n=1 Tax=Desulfonema magnum TaxID=45655 RepID=A0A975BLR8_9BACT|nr:Uncharacterized protein dnm_038230 [Desulfonema magnum]